ncbi:MAG: aspartate dehydrogenase, partial [Rhodobacteraceae bacterium]|nr:aspartate dehydrogenase [Paracoccaceae bacterium]
VTLEMCSQNYPSPRNNRTSMVVALSVLAALRRERATLRIGS